MSSTQSTPPATDPTAGRPTRRWLPITAAVVAVVVAFALGTVVHSQVGSAGTATPGIEELEATGAAPAEGPVADDPPPTPPNNTNQSFLASTPRVTIDPDLKAHTFAESCPSGWYVRPGMGSAQSPTSVNPAYIELASSRYIDSEGDSSASPVNPGFGWSIFTAFKAKFTNSGVTSKHEVQLQYWCDKIPDWYDSKAAASTHKPLGFTKSKLAEPSTKGGIGPVPYNCYYCSFDFSSLTNSATGLALDSSNADAQGPLIVQNPGSTGNQQWYLMGQPGGGASKNNIATFGIWRYKTLLDYAIVENGDGTVSFANASSGKPPTNGDWYFVDHGAGMTIGAVQLINTATGHCLAASGTAGSGVIATTCDATDKTQYWTEPKA